MANTIQLDVVTPERLVVAKKVEMVVAPGAEGEFGVLAGHIPFLSTLRSGELRYTAGGQVNYLAVTGGFAEVGPDKVTVLADSAEEAREIDIDRAKRAKDRAEERLRLTGRKRWTTPGPRRPCKGPWPGCGWPKRPAPDLSTKQTRRSGPWPDRFLFRGHPRSGFPPGAILFPTTRFLLTKTGQGSLFTLTIR